MEYFSYRRGYFLRMVCPSLGLIVMYFLLIFIMMNTPWVRIVERAGTKIMDEIGDTNLWKSEWCYQRKTYLPCQGQVILGAEIEDAALKQVCGDKGGDKEGKTGMWPKEDC